MRVKLEAVTKEMTRAEVELLVANTAWASLNAVDQKIFTREDPRVRKDQFGHWKVTFFANEQPAPAPALDEEIPF